MNALTWVDFLAGIKIVNRDERASTILDLDNANQWELISLLVDTQVSQVEAMKLWEGMSWLQKKGMGVRLPPALRWGPLLPRLRHLHCRGECFYIIYRSSILMREKSSSV